MKQAALDKIIEGFLELHETNMVNVKMGVMEVVKNGALPTHIELAFPSDFRLHGIPVKISQTANKIQIFGLQRQVEPELIH